MKKIVLSIIAMGCVALMFLAFSSSDLPNDDLEKQSAKDTYPVIQPVIMDTCIANDYVADIQAYQHIEIRSRVGSFIEKIHVDEGSHVTNGQVLITLNGDQYRAELLVAKAALNNAISNAKKEQLEYNNTKKLADKKIVSETELEIAEANLQSANSKVKEAESRVTNAELNLSYTKIIAPFNGIIGRIPNKTGSVIEEGDLLTTLSDNFVIYAYFRVSEQEYLNLIGNSGEQNGQEVALLLANGQPYDYTGKIEATDNQINHETGNITFRATFPNPDHLLKHGATGEVVIKQPVGHAMLIPQKATFEIQEKIFVFVVDKDHKVSRKEIKPKFRLTDLYIIESGLDKTDIVIYEGLQSISDGDYIDYEHVTFLNGNKELIVSTQTH